MKLIYWIPVIGSFIMLYFNKPETLHTPIIKLPWRVNASYVIIFLYQCFCTWTAVSYYWPLGVLFILTSVILEVLKK